MVQKCDVIFSSFLDHYSKTEMKKREDTFIPNQLKRDSYLSLFHLKFYLLLVIQLTQVSLFIMNFYERDLIVIPVTNLQVKFNVALPFYWKKHPHLILVVSDDCHQFSIFIFFQFLFSLFLGALETKNNLFKYVCRQCPFLLGILVMSHIKGNNDIFIVPLLHDFPNAYFRLVPSIILTFLTLGKILLEIFHTLLLQNSTQECKHPLLLPFSLNLAQILMFLYFSTVRQL